MSQPGAIPHLSSAQRGHLLGIARETAGELLARKTPSPIVTPSIPGCFGGVFATFWRDGALRGCVGSLISTSQLERTVQDVTHASLNDPRFASAPINLPELPDLQIELSILSHLQRTYDPAALVPGTHGIVVRQAGRSGCFLPKVATEHDWSSEEFLDACCKLKARLPPDTWREPTTETYLFTVDSFSEEPAAQRVGNR